MKRFLLFWPFWMTAWLGWAQQTATSTNDTLKVTGTDPVTVISEVSPAVDGNQRTDKPVISFEGHNFREYDGFLLDLESLMQPSAVPSTELIPPSLLYNPFANYRTPVTDYTRRFQSNDRITYGATTVSGYPTFFHNGKGWQPGGAIYPLGHLFPGGGLWVPGMGPFGIGPAPTAPTLRSATFRLNNGWSITTYGEYDADGYKVHNPSILPGQNRSFNGAFEMKSENGNFGIRIGVQRY